MPANATGFAPRSAPINSVIAPESAFAAYGSTMFQELPARTIFIRAPPSRSNSTVSISLGLMPASSSRSVVAGGLSSPVNDMTSSTTPRTKMMPNRIADRRKFMGDDPVVARRGGLEREPSGPTCGG